MPKPLKLLLLLISFVPLSALAKVYELNLSLCEGKTSCSVCVEDLKVNFTVNNANKTVTISGKTTSGEQLKELLTKCSVQSANDWQCHELRGLIRVTSGILEYVPQETLLGKNIEICMR